MGAIVENEIVYIRLEVVSMLPEMPIDVDIHPHVEWSARSHFIGDNVDRPARFENLSRPALGNSDELIRAIDDRKLIHAIPFLFRFPILLPILYQIFQIFQGKSWKILRISGMGKIPH